MNFLYSIVVRSPEQIDEFIKNENIKASMASIVAISTLAFLNFNTRKGESPTPTFHRYPLSVSTSILPSIFYKKYNKNDPASTLITDLLMKSLSIAKCALSLLVDGFETEAFSSWRTLHECECTHTFRTFWRPLINRYLKHMQYGIAFKDVMEK